MASEYVSIFYNHYTNCLTGPIKRITGYKLKIARSVWFVFEKGKKTLWKKEKMLTYMKMKLLSDPVCLISALISLNSQFYVEIERESCVVLSLMQKYRLFGEEKEFVPCAILIFKVSLYEVYIFYTNDTFLI